MKSQTAVAMKLKVLILFLLVVGFSEAGERVEIGRFSQGDLSGWQTKEFKGVSHYQLTTKEGIDVLHAKSQSAASGLYKKQRVDLFKTPYLNWRWRIEKKLSGLNEREKSGDDYAARVYVVVSGGWAFWKTRAVNYVWSGSQEKGSVWPNAFVGQNAMMVALRDPNDKLSQWYPERRNVLNDLRMLYGEEIRYIDAVAIMTDTDNSEGYAESDYGDIFFSD